jgi:hypothetical protein
VLDVVLSNQWKTRENVTCDGSRMTEGRTPIDWCGSDLAGMVMGK